MLRCRLIHVDRLLEYYGQNVHAYDAAGDITLSTSDTAITLDTEVKDTSSFTHVNGTSNITINTTGTYLVTYYMTTYCTSGVTRTESESNLQWRL